MKTINPNQRLPKRRVLALLLAAACVADVNAAPGQGGHPGGPPGPPPAPSAEQLATVPSLTADQQVQLHKLLLERRDAHQAIAKRSRDLMETQRDKDRVEHERIDDANSERVRKLLGEDGFRQYAQWQLSHRGPGPHAGHGGPHGEAGDGPDDEPGDRGPGERGPGDRGGRPGSDDNTPSHPPARTE
jgi:hypothetical protein